MIATRAHLFELARACGIAREYEDGAGERHKASTETLLALLRTLGVEVACMDDVPGALMARREAELLQGLEPVIVVWDGEPVVCDVTVPVGEEVGSVEGIIECEDGEIVSQRVQPERVTSEAEDPAPFVKLRVRFDRGLAWGYHTLRMEWPGRTLQALVISAPRRAYAPEGASGGRWGVFLPLYALRGEGNWGIGDLTELKNLMGWTSEKGGRVVGTLPLLAAYLDKPCEPSPYSPASRMAWNEIYLDVARIPGLEDCRGALKILQSSRFAEETARLRQTSQVDYRAVMALKRDVLQVLAHDFFERRPGESFGRFERFLERCPHMDDYAAFRATYERRKEPWQRWPGALRGGKLSAADYDESAKRLHLFAQWAVVEQLEELAGATDDGLYLDLPLGVRGDGYDVWRNRDIYAGEASAGAPPDAVWTTGQVWGLPPLHPDRIRRDGYRHVRDYLRHHLRVARTLRIDHVMQLHRLFWIPNGKEAGEGAYVRYRADELYAVLSLESHRWRTALVGENLGTVPEVVNRSMDRHRLQKMFVLEYEMAPPEDDEEGGKPTIAGGKEVAPVETSFRGHGEMAEAAPFNEVPAGCIASLNTHDMPSFASWWRGRDIALAVELGYLDEAGASRRRRELVETRNRIVDWLKARGWLTQRHSDDDVLRAALRYLSISAAGMVLVNLEDLWLEEEPQNVPGTGPELPNWRRKAARSFEEFSTCLEVNAALAEVAQFRRQRVDQGEGMS